MLMDVAQMPERKKETLAARAQKAKKTHAHNQEIKSAVVAEDATILYHALTGELFDEDSDASLFSLAEDDGEGSDSENE